MRYDEIDNNYSQIALLYGIIPCVKKN